MLTGEHTAESKIKGTEVKNLDIIPSELDLAGSEITIAKQDDYLYKLKVSLEPLLIKNSYDVIVIDCPPSLGILFMNALNVAHEDNHSYAM